MARERLHAEVLDGPAADRLPVSQQIIWNKGRAVLTRTHYWYQHEPCWYVRKRMRRGSARLEKTATIWDSASPKFIMGGSDEREVRSPDAKACRLDAAPDSESPSAS